MTTTPEDAGRDSSLPPDPRPRGHIGAVVAGSLAAGLVAALVLVAVPFIPAEEGRLTGAILCGFALGWAMLALLSTRLTDQPQRWAWVPAIFMGLGGLLLVVFGSAVQGVLNWLWPPVLLAVVVWMVVRSRAQLRSKTRRWLLYPVFAVLALAAVGGGYETVREAMDARTYAMPGQLIDVGGHRLHLSCTGSGTPTVVLEAGGGEMSSNLGWITPAVARDTRVCVYDRAGRGWSEPADTPQDAAQIATDLHTLLQRGHVPGPYVLAGHSFGGLYVLTFADRFPDDVAGMVLVDSTAPALAANPGMGLSTDVGSSEVITRGSAVLSVSARLGLARLFDLFSFGTLPPQSLDEVRATGATVGTLRSTIDEYVQANASTQEAAALRNFGDKPLVVLTAGSGSDAAHLADQDHLATLSSNSVHRVIDGASHEALVAEPGASATTTQAIIEVSVRAQRSTTR